MISLRPGLITGLYTSLEMNYWPAEVTGLGSLHNQLFDLIELMRVDGTRTARKM